MTPRNNPANEPRKGVKPTVGIAMPVSPEMAELLEDPAISKVIADTWEVIDRLFCQVTNDLPMADNADVVGREIHGVRKAREIFKTACLNGKAMKAEQASNKS